MLEIVSIMVPILICVIIGDTKECPVRWIMQSYHVGRCFAQIRFWQ